MTERSGRYCYPSILGTVLIQQQVSHHPPVGAGDAENDHFVYDITSKVKTNS